jgi:hypothetical protein
VALHRAPLADVLGRGVVAAVPDFGDRATAFWFVAASPLLWVSGRLLRAAEAHGDHRAQRDAGRVLAAVGAIGAAAMPVSGFWSLVAVGLRAAARPRPPRHLAAGDGAGAGVAGP